MSYLSFKMKRFQRCLLNNLKQRLKIVGVSLTFCYFEAEKENEIKTIIILI